MFVRRLVSWVTGWGGPLGTASGQQLGLPLAPIIDQTKLTPPDAALQISAVFACVEILAQTISTLPLYVYRDKGGVREPAVAVAARKPKSVDDAVGVSFGDGCQSHASRECLCAH